jgi:hypothetical protein
MLVIVRITWKVAPTDPTVDERRVPPDSALPRLRQHGARRALSGFEARVGDYCLGTIGEIVYGEPSFTPRG